jgi:hypothetical protein
MAKSRAELRSSIFSSTNTKPKSKLVDFFGEQIEVRQPKVGVVLDLRNAGEKNIKQMLISTLIQYCYVPGTDEKVFEEADEDQLMEMPFGEDLTRLQTAISELTNVNIQADDAAKN